MVVLTINANDPTPEFVRSWMAQRGYDFTVLWDDGYLDEAGVEVFPTMWILDREGRTAFDWSGGNPEHFLQELEWRVEAVLQG